MPFSHHSHSGQFCGHAKDTLAQILAHAVHTRRVRTFALTEHMPRSSPADLYPEELEAGLDVPALWALFESYVAEATSLRRRFAAEAAARTSPTQHACDILIGFEIEWIRAADSEALVRRVLTHPGWKFDFFVGSVHHVRGVPIDFDAPLYARAVEACGGGEEGLYADYFDAQFEMLSALKPRVVGHFDLIRLLSAEPERGMRGWEGGRVWGKILRNLEVVKGYGGLLELNSAALRKMLKEPYPRREICEVWMEMGGGFVMSDDSHGIEQVGTCYAGLLAWIKDLGLRDIKYLAKGGDGEVVVKSMGIEELEKEPFWST